MLSAFVRLKIPRTVVRWIRLAFASVLACNVQWAFRTSRRLQKGRVVSKQVDHLSPHSRINLPIREALEFGIAGKPSVSHHPLMFQTPAPTQMKKSEVMILKEYSLSLFVIAV